MLRDKYHNIKMYPDSAELIMNKPSKNRIIIGKISIFFAKKTLPKR